MPGKTMKDNDFDFDLLYTCSANDCTGLIAASPQTEAEWDAYHEIYDFGLPRADQKRLDEMSD